ncbi:hypothetical protein [Nocardioides sp.]|uniref:hypothetical protein n=1 Tax=Nocardioides sp. TaxID=35761 RepID=UPI001A273BA6|nr:hypothetical protein [Nocardioides sp.]MBJ7359667.1 hypothetical protein [Nocardioides sp.]
MTGVRETGARSVQYVVLLLLAAGTVVLCYLALTRETAADSNLVRDEPSLATPTESSTAPEPSASAADPSPSGESVKVPKVPDQRLADFTKGDDLPDGAVTYDSPSNVSRMRLTDTGLTHGAVEDGATDGLGLVETELESDVRSLGFRVLFPEPSSGSAALMAWESSAAEALEAGDPLPSGMRFVATPGTWTLSMVTEGGEETLAEGSFEAATGPLEFRVVRDGDEIFVVDPTGLVTAVTKARAGELVGPFASWGLVETGPDEAPAVIESVRAG